MNYTKLHQETTFAMRIREKNYSELYRQHDLVSETYDERLAPLSVDPESLLEMRPKELKERFPRRYELYVRAYRKKTQQIEDIFHMRDESEDEHEISYVKRHLAILNGLDRYIRDHHETFKSLDVLHEHQETVFEDIRDELEKGLRLLFF